MSLHSPFDAPLGPASKAAVEARKQVNKAWICGCGATLAVMVRSHGKEGLVLAEKVVESMGLKLAHFRGAGVEKDDMTQLRRVFK